MLPPDRGEALKKQRVVIADQTKVLRTRMCITGHNVYNGQHRNVFGISRHILDAKIGSQGKKKQAILLTSETHRTISTTVQYLLTELLILLNNVDIEVCLLISHPKTHRTFTAGHKCIIMHTKYLFMIAEDWS
jgi:hypothetical protein